jgi:protein TonB
MVAPARAQIKHPIRVGSRVQQANLISSVAPVYPPEARRKGIDGKVTLEVLIGNEGHVSQVKPISGPEDLIQSAGARVFATPPSGLRLFDPSKPLC